MEISAVVLLSWAIALVRADLRWRRLPNVLTVPAVVATMAMAPLARDTAVGLITAAGVYGVAFLAGGCGGGDVKLAVVVGGVVGGVTPTLLAVLCAQLITLFEVGVRRCRRRSGTREITARPHGPALLIGAAVTLGLGG